MIYESVSLVVEGNDLATSEGFEPNAICINDTKRRQFVTRSGMSRLRCGVWHLHHKWAMNSLAAVEFFGTVLEQVCHFKIDAIAGDDNTAAHKYDKKTRIPRSSQFLSCQHAKRERDAT